MSEASHPATDSAAAVTPTTEASEFFRSLQLEICEAIEQLDGHARFNEDAWNRADGGGGRSRVLTDGRVFEKAGVNWSEVHGTLDPAFATHLPGDGLEFHACGVSLVIHPKTPMIPTVHANFRSLRKGSAEWFGGGADLTPYYPYLDDVVHFHRTLKAACDGHDPQFYEHFKAWCDGYFYLPHRQETRGVGGLFFDYLGLSESAARTAARGEAKHVWPGELSREAAFAFVQDAGRAFVPAYLPIAARRQSEAYGEAERDFQLVRRGRYAEFNLLYDRGTVFGLRTGGRVESILMSMPPHARWVYGHTPEPGSREAALWDYLVPRDWLGDPTAAADTLWGG